MSEQVALTPLHHVIPTGKKRKRNFRPTSLKNVKPVNKLALSHDAVKEKDEGEEVPLEPEYNNEQEEDEEEELAGVTEEPLPKASTVVRPRTRPKKSKKIAVSVGPVRPPTADSSQEAAPLMTETDTQILPSSQSKATSSVGTARFLYQVEDTSAIDELDQAILAKDQGDLPKLNAFCSRFKVKRKAKGAANREVGAGAPPQREHRIRETRDLLNNNNPTTAGPVVQIVNGEIVLQESSVVINRANTKMGDEDASVVEEEAQLAVVGATANSFTNRNKSQRWTADQTRLFYQALRQVGTDFGTMEAFFSEKRTRKQLKRKYQAELIRNPQLIEKALDPSIRADLDLSVFQLSEEETRRIYEPLVIVDQNTKEDSPELDGYPSDTVKRAPLKSDPRGDDNEEEENEAIEEDAMEEQNRDMRPPENTDPPSDPFEDPMFENTNTADDDPLFGEEENEDTAAVSLIPAVATTVKSKKKPSFRSLRTKKKK